MHHSLRRGILPLGGADTIPCRWISQLEVHQLLISGPQVAYPVGLNGGENPIVTLLLESLANGISLIGGESVYLKINIPPSPADKPDQKVLPIGKFSSIIMDSPHKATPPKLEGEISMIMEVWNLLSQVMLDALDPGSKNSTPRRPNPVVILMPPPHKLKELLQPVDTSFQASAQEEAEMAEASLEGVPTSISPITATTRSESITPSVDTVELWENANQALNKLLTTKACIEACRQRAVWELGTGLCWNESEATESLKEANTACSHATQDAKAQCVTIVKKAKITYTQTIQEAKVTQACDI